MYMLHVMVHITKMFELTSRCTAHMHRGLQGCQRAKTTHPVRRILCSNLNGGGGDVTSRNKRRHRIITRFPPRGSYARAIAQSCRRRGGGVHGARQADSEMLLELSIPVRVRLQCLRLELTPITQQAALSVANPMTACHRRRCRMAA